MFFNKILSFITATTLALSLISYNYKTTKSTDYLGSTAKPSINVTAAEKDNVPPELSISFDEAFVKVGTTPIVNVKATDNADKFVQVVKTWSEGALDTRGRLTEGVHVLTITATDVSHNSTVKQLPSTLAKTGITLTT